MFSLTLHSPHRIVLVALPPVQALDVTGPLDVFSMANVLSEKGGRAAPYELLLASPGCMPVTTTSGITMLPACDLFDENVSPDTVLVSGGPGPREAVNNPEWINGLRALCQRAARVGSICTGAFPLAATGMLDKQRVTTHWAHFEEFSSQFPAIQLDRDALFVDAGTCHTSAGISAGIDYALALVETDLGRPLALAVAQSLVVFLKRPGGQAQFSAQLASQLNALDADRFHDLIKWVEQNLALDLTVELMAEKVAMSPRNFARRFVEKMQMAPAKYVERVRVDEARRMLTDTELSLGRVAERCGFGSAETMRQAFKLHINIAPADFRARFRSVRTA